MNTFSLFLQLLSSLPIGKPAFRCYQKIKPFSHYLKRSERFVQSLFLQENRFLRFLFLFFFNMELICTSDDTRNELAPSTKTRTQECGKIQLVFQKFGSCKPKDTFFPVSEKATSVFICIWLEVWNTHPLTWPALEGRNKKSRSRL